MSQTHPEADIAVSEEPILRIIRSGRGPRARQSAEAGLIGASLIYPDVNERN